MAYYQYQSTTKDKILELTRSEMKERYDGKVNFYFYEGACKDEDAAVADSALMGQSWSVNETLDYVPTQDIRNKVKPLIRKQARFMFGVAPYVLLKPLNGADKQTAEDLRKFIDKILEDNLFWSETLKAFRLATVKKRVLLRIEANPNKPIKIFYNDVDDFSYVIAQSDHRVVESISLVTQDRATAHLEAKDQIWFRYTYEMREDGFCYLITRTFNGVEDLDEYTEEEKNTGLSQLPGFVILNGGGIGNTEGESDVQDLMSSQNEYNHKISDFGDALRFGMFAPPVITDATENSVNNIVIAPNALIPLVSLNDKGAQAKRLETNIPVDAIEKFLDRANKDMYETLSIPLPEQVKDIASAKSIKFMYTDLIARCEEKWNDWEPAIKWLIRLIIEANKKFKCYPDWKDEWNDLDFSIMIQHKYPVPEDESDKKTIAMAEVEKKVRSHKSYIKDFTDIEDADVEWKDIIEETSAEADAGTDQFGSRVLGDLGAGTTE